MKSAWRLLLLLLIIAGMTSLAAALTSQVPSNKISTSVAAPLGSAQNMASWGKLVPSNTASFLWPYRPRDNDGDSDDIPEPQNLVLLGSGLLIGAGFLRRKLEKKPKP